MIEVKNLTEFMENLKNFKAIGSHVCVVVEIPGNKRNEIIVNHNEDIDTKSRYYQSAYNEDLSHKHAPGIRLVGVMLVNQHEYKIISGKWG